MKTTKTTWTLPIMTAKNTEAFFKTMSKTWGNKSIKEHAEKVNKLLGK